MLGLRNAFTFAFQPDTGLMYVSEVGAAAWEEINEGRPGGNYGWPDTEGPFSASQYPDYLNPVYAYRHDRAGQAYAITGAVFYDAPGAARSLPAEYDGEFFFADLAGGADAGASDGWIKTFDPVTRQVRDFGTQIQRPVDLDVGPDGALYYLSNSRPGDPGHVYRVASAGQASSLSGTPSRSRPVPRPSSRRRPGSADIRVPPSHRPRIPVGDRPPAPTS